MLAFKQDILVLAEIYFAVAITCLGVSPLNGPCISKANWTDPSYSQRITKNIFTCMHLSLTGSNGNLAVIGGAYF